MMNYELTYRPLFIGNLLSTVFMFRLFGTSGLSFVFCLLSIYYILYT